MVPGEDVCKSRPGAAYCEVENANNEAAITVDWSAHRLLVRTPNGPDAHFHTLKDNERRTPFRVGREERSERERGCREA
jgi:hypothetical protein